MNVRLHISEMENALGDDQTKKANMTFLFFGEIHSFVAVKIVFLDKVKYKMFIGEFVQTV